MSFPDKETFEYECAECGTSVSIKDLSREKASTTLLSLTPWTTTGDWRTFRCPECSLKEYRED